MKIEFVSYDGKYPNLCSGTLTLKADNKFYRLKYALRSGGGLGEGYVPYFGAWDVDIDALPDELKDYHNDIVKCVNENVEYGCCGGCA